MEKQEIDQLYHQLRLLNVKDDILQKEAVAGIVSHLTDTHGDYTGLLRFLSYYGERFILPKVVEVLTSGPSQYTPRLPIINFSRVIDIGAGFGWLGRGISNAFGLLPAVFVDKRQWILTDIVADIETTNGVKRILDILRDGDLIVMAEVLHCLENPTDTMQCFSKWPKLVVEYSAKTDYQLSYEAQIKKFGCKQISDIRSVFPAAQIVTECLDTHNIWLVLPDAKKE